MLVEQLLVAEHIAKNGPPRLFECGVAGSFEYFNSYLLRFGIRLRMQSWRCHISKNDGPWHPIQRAQVLEIVDRWRVSEGLEPIKAVHR